MRKHLLVVIAFIALVGFTPANIYSQTGYNAVIEYITGTWCQWCPCGHDIIHDIEQNWPNTMVLAYHGAGSDPWQSWTVGIRSMLFGGSQAYPTGIVSRRTGVLSRGGWPNPVTIQSSTLNPGVSIQVNNKQYNSGTRTITANIQMTALENLTGDYYVMFILTENNIVYPQTGNGSCQGSSSYIHNHVVKAMINGDQGTLLATTDNWTQGNAVTVPLNYVIPTSVVDANAKINIFVYKNEAPLNTNGHIQQSKMEPVTSPTGINQQNGIATSYNLEQNYPNPFNPTTNIKFSVPEDGNVSLKFYDMMGREVASYIDNGFLKAGIYNAEFDGTNLSSGVYFYTLKTSSFVDTKKMMLVK